MKEIEDTFSRFDRIPSCDRQTDRQTDRCIARKTYSTERLDASIGQVYKPTSASCELDLWPPDHKSWSFHTLASWTYTSLCQFATISVHLFSKYYVRKVGNGRTDGRTDKSITLCLRSIWTGAGIKITKLYGNRTVSFSMQLLQYLWTGESSDVAKTKILRPRPRP